MPIQNGSVLNKRYRIMRLVGSGGMAQVYLAEDLMNGRMVAIKALKTELNDDEEFVRRFDAEARAASALSHENIVKVLGVGVDLGVRYMVQEFVDGVSLKSLIQHYKRIDWRVAVPIFVQIAMALRSAHAGGVIHRDIKPHNILIDREKKAMVTDFGIARAGSSATNGQSGSTLGSVHYFSPEQARGSIVGEKADLYSLGILMYETLTGRLPFDGDTAVAIAIKHLSTAAQAPCEIEATIPKGLSDIVLKCMQKSPDDRYASAEDLINELDAFMINPQGVYGVGLDQMRQEPSVESPVALPIVEKKVLDYEDVLSRRKRRRFKDSGITIAIVLLSFALLFAVCVYFYRYIHDSIEQSEATVYVMPDFKNQLLEDAIAELEENKIEHSVREEYSEEVEAGYIIRQSIPAKEKMGKRSLSRQELVVSKGSEFVAIEDFTGQDGEETMRILRELGLKVTRVREVNANVAEGLVIATDPLGGSTLKIGDEIKVIVSSGTRDVHVSEMQLFGNQLAEAVKKLESESLNVTISVPEGYDESQLYVSSIKDITGNELLWNGQLVIQTGDAVTVVGQPWSYFHPPTTDAPEEDNGQ
ncbi:MAG: Stk1 family PASTA domain-containing Ser/Thr kinase [Eubacteriales bacterium]|nr:Stk1 family PASTA domain-containing Ser/Thr kinase [Eubacteriales bacterium]